MPSSHLTSACVIIAAAATMLTTYTLWQTHSPQAKRRRLRRKLPKDLNTWRCPGDSWASLEQAWIDLENVFREGGLQLWPAVLYALLSPGSTYPLSNGYTYIGGHRTDPSGPGTAGALRMFQYLNPNIHPARTRDGLDVIVRVIVIHGEGHEHLRILRKVATGVNSLFSNNHALPMLAEFQFEDVIWGIFPKVGGYMTNLYGEWARNSAGDIVEIIMQMLEALAFIHTLNVAHRDAFKDNFVLQWQPESFKTKSISPSRPRVYLIDFEVAIEFPPECPAEERVVTGYPLGGSFLDLETYKRPHAPECASGQLYCPFKLDVWQLGQSLLGVRSTVAGIDKVLDDMYSADADQRPNAQDALDRMRDVVNSIPPNSLLIEPWMEDDWFTEMQVQARLEKENMQ